MLKDKLIREIVQLHLSDKVNNDVLELIKYTEKDIEKCIEALSRKEKIT